MLCRSGQVECAPSNKCYKCGCPFFLKSVRCPKMMDMRANLRMLQVKDEPPTGAAATQGPPADAAPAGAAAATAGNPPPPAAAAAPSAPGSRLPSGLLSRASSVSLKEAVCQRAKKFKEQYFNAGVGGGDGAAYETLGLKELRSLCERLPEDPSLMQPLLEVSVGQWLDKSGHGKALLGIA